MYHNIVYKEAVKKIESKDEEKIIDGIKSLRESGKPEAVKLVAGVLEETKDENTRKECANFFNDIKDPKAVELIVELIKNTKNEESLQVLVSCAWQNNLDFSAYLGLFTDIVLTKSYLVAYEAFTVIENHIDKLEKKEANKIQKKVENGITKVEKEKQPMVQELLHIISDLKKN